MTMVGFDGLLSSVRYSGTFYWLWILFICWSSISCGAKGSTYEGEHLGCSHGKCYRLYHQKVTWQQARAICRENRTGQLAVIPDADTQDTIFHVIRETGIVTSVWVGGRNRGNTWRWLDGSLYEGKKVDFYDDPLARCGYLYTGSVVRVGAASCGHLKKYLCTSIFGNIPNRGSNPETWSASNKDCAARSKQLPIFSREEMQAVSDRLVHTYGREQYWIGLCRTGWIWEGIQKNAEEYMHFHGKTPYCTPNNCLTIDYRGYWFNADCRTTRGFLCEMQNLPSPLGPKDVSGSGPGEGKPVMVDSHDGHHDPHDPHYDYDHNHSDHHEDHHDHSMLIGIIVGLGVLITALVVLLVLLLRKKAAAKKKRESQTHHNMDDIYSEIREPVLPPTSNYYDVAEPQHTKNEPKQGTTELTTFKNKRLSSIPDYDGPACPTVPPPEQPPLQNGRYHNNTPTTSNGETGPYAVSYIACTPKNEKGKSSTLDSVAKLPVAPTAPPIEGTVRKFPEETVIEEDRYLLPKEKFPPVPARRLPKNSTAAHGHGRDKKGRQGKTDTEATSLMLEENELYSDGGDADIRRK